MIPIACYKGRFLFFNFCFFTHPGHWLTDWSIFEFGYSFDFAEKFDDGRFYLIVPLIAARDQHNEYISILIPRCAVWLRDLMHIAVSRSPQSFWNIIILFSGAQMDNRDWKSRDTLSLMVTIHVTWWWWWPLLPVDGDDPCYLLMVTISVTCW